MISPDSERRFSEGAIKENFTKRRALALCLRTFTNQLLKEIPQVEQVGMNVLSPLANAFIETQTRAWQVVANPSSYDEKTGEFVALVREVDLQLFEEIRHLPLDKRPPAGQEDDAVIRVINGGPLRTNEAYLISLFMEELLSPVKLN